MIMSQFYSKIKKLLTKLRKENWLENYLLKLLPKFPIDHIIVFPKSTFQKVIKSSQEMEISWIEIRYLVKYLKN